MREELRSAARTAVVGCVALKPHETCLVLTDSARENVGRALWEAACEVGGEALLVEMRPRSRDGEEPPAAIARLMASVDVVLAPTTRSLTHTAARREACAAGVRVATLPGIAETTMVRCLNADYEAIAARSRRVAELLTAARTVHVWTDAGTDVTVDIDGIHGIASTGLVREPGAFGNLPSGEAYLMPREGTARGTIVVDGSMAGIGALGETDPITWKVEGGRVVEVTGGDTASALLQMLTAVGPDAFNLAEFGVGTNDAARIIGSILEDEKVMGTVHFAVGNNVSMGGTVNVPLHLDGILLSPNVDLDERPLLRDGVLLLD